MLTDTGDGVFELTYVGLGQRVGPDPATPPTSFDEFLKYMQTTFWEKMKNKEFADIYHPDGRWIFVADFTLLKLIEIGVVFYDVTPFYALQISLVGGPAKGFSFEITYTKVTDTIGLYAIKIALPDSLRTFQVGVASLTMPTLSIAIYTNGDWKADLGFPDGDDWSGSFRIQAQAGPVPVTGSGGFYIAVLSSATDPDVFKGTYATIAAFGFALRLGVGKDFVAGPLKAGVSVHLLRHHPGGGGLSDRCRRHLPHARCAVAAGAGRHYRRAIRLTRFHHHQGERQRPASGEHRPDPDLRAQGAGRRRRLDPALHRGERQRQRQRRDQPVPVFDHDQFQLQGLVPLRVAIARLQPAEDAAARQLSRNAPARRAGGNRALPGTHRRATAALPARGDGRVPRCDRYRRRRGSRCRSAWEYDPAPPQNPDYAAFRPFEAVTTQLATFALMHALDLPSYDAVVTLGDDPVSGKPGLLSLDSDPDLLTGWMGYDDILGQLANFTATIAQPTQSTQATVFPMPPFLQLATTGRTNGTSADDLSYSFASKNLVAESYLQTVDAYFNQLFVNQTPTPPPLRLGADTLTPLPTEIFVDYFKGLVRGAVHQLLVTMQDQQLTQAKLTTLFSAAAGAPTPQSQSLFQQLAGQMSSSMRSGIRLPYTSGLTVPSGDAATTTNPLFALLWQEFPVGGFAANDAYTIDLTNPDTTQKLDHARRALCAQEEHDPRLLRPDTRRGDAAGQSAADRLHRCRPAILRVPERHRARRYAEPAGFPAQFVAASACRRHRAGGDADQVARRRRCLSARRHAAAGHRHRAGHQCRADRPADSGRRTRRGARGSVRTLRRKPGRRGAARTDTRRSARR